uniref:Uncharacterized protein n=1 Tax=Bactrocera dorsalis TaxID=27457 RepID=A0A034V9W5_BACDO
MFGIIFDIPADITEEELKENIISPIKILKTMRVNRTQEGMKFPTRRVKIVFDGLEVPKEVTFGYTKIKVKPFVAPLLQIQPFRTALQATKLNLRKMWNYPRQQYKMQQGTIRKLQREP